MPLRLLIERLAENPIDEGSFTEPPYMAFMGLQYRQESGGLTIIMPFRKRLIGSPVPPRLHGGSVGALMEVAGLVATLQAMHKFGPLPDALPKPINVTVEYLREGGTQDTYATGIVTRLGRRVANVRAEAWQAQRERLIATAHLNFILEDS